MSLRPTAPEFQPKKASVPINDDVYSYNKSTRTMTAPLLGYEFPYTMKAMPINITPTKRVWSEMSNLVTMYIRRYY